MARDRVRQVKHREVKEIDVISRSVETPWIYLETPLSSSSGRGEREH
jgi:hypothetical protein